MSTWIVRANPARFRIHDFISDNGFVEYNQKMRFCVGDTVYLYITAPYKRVEYKMVVERIDIPLSKAFDDSSYFLVNPIPLLDDDVFVRFKCIARVQTDELCYKKLLEHDFNYTMQSDRQINSETEAYIERFFSEKC